MTTKQIDDIYVVGDLLMTAGCWSTVDDLLMYYGTSAWRQDVQLLLSWATITLISQKKLKNRKWFMDQCLKFHSNPKIPDLWKGLYEKDSDPSQNLKKLGAGFMAPYS